MINMIADVDTVLISGPVLSGRRRLFHQVLESWAANSVIISTRDLADSVRMTHQEYSTATKDDPETFIVDSLTNSLDHSVRDTSRTKYAQHPSDLGSIGTKFISILGQNENRKLSVGVTTVSPLFVYSDAADVFKFVDTLIRKSRGAGWPVVITIDPYAHDETVVEQLLPLFEAVIETRRTDEGDQEFRIREPHPTEWESF